jgi:hypothetical protein
MKTYSDEELIEFITSGKAERLAMTFLFHTAVFTWHPRTGGYLGYMDDVRERAEAVRNFLRERGQAFSSLDEVRAFGIAQNFPNIDQFLESIEKWREVDRKRLEKS